MSNALSAHPCLGSPCRAAPYRTSPRRPRHAMACPWARPPREIVRRNRAGLCIKPSPFWSCNAWYDTHHFVACIDAVARRSIASAPTPRRVLARLSDLCLVGGAVPVRRCHLNLHDLFRSLECSYGTASALEARDPVQAGGLTQSTMRLQIVSVYSESEQTWNFLTSTQSQTAPSVNRDCKSLCGSTSGRPKCSLHQSPDLLANRSL